MSAPFPATALSNIREGEDHFIKPKEFFWFGSVKLKKGILVQNYRMPKVVRAMIWLIGATIIKEGVHHVFSPPAIFHHSSLYLLLA